MEGKGKEFTTTIQIAGKISPTLGKSFNEVEKKISKSKVAWAAIGTAATAAAGAAVKFGTEATKKAVEYEKQMSNVATLLDGDKASVNKRIDELGGELLKVSNVSGKSTDDLTEGLYNVISALGDSEDSMKTLEIAAKAATAGNATTTDSINLLSAVTKGYGDTSAKAQQKVADMAFATVKLGQTSFPELAANMGKVIPLASTLAVKQEDLFGAMATLTGVTGGTAEVSTQLKAVMQGFLKPTKDMQKAMEKYGYANGKAMLESEGLQGSLDLLMEAAGGNELQFAELFSSVEAKSAVLAMAGAQSDNLREKTQAMYESAGAAEGAFDAQTDNLATRMEDLKNKFENAKTAIGMKLLPVVQEAADKAFPYLEQAVDKIPPIFDKLKDAIGYVKDNINWILPLAGQLAIAFTVLKIATHAAAIQAKFKAMWDGIMLTKQALVTAGTWAQAAANWALNSSMLLVVAVIAGLVVAGIALYKNWDKIKEKASSLLGEIKYNFNAIKEKISGAWEIVKTKTSEKWTAIKTSLSNAWNGIKEKASGFATGVKDKITAVWTKLKETLLAPFKALGDKIDEVKQKFSGIGDKLKGFGSGVGEKLSGALPKFATGGFTNGPSIAGEAGREAVISFNPAYRDENLSYWAKAGRMLGADNADYSLGGNSGGNYMDLGGVTFSPNITITGQADKGTIMDAIEAEYPEFIDFLEEWLTGRGAPVYG